METIRLNEAVYDRLAGEVWFVAAETFYLPEWWVKAEVSGGKLRVCVDDGDGKVIRKTLSQRQLLVAYLSMENPTHCGGCDVVDDPDSCSADLILQQAVFGKIIYS